MVEGMRGSKETEPILFPLGPIKLLRNYFLLSIKIPFKSTGDISGMVDE